MKIIKVDKPEIYESKHTADDIVRHLIGFDEYLEENKKKFLKKYNQELYKKLYEQGKNNNNREKIQR
jgi:hypothetical protein